MPTQYHQFFSVTFRHGYFPDGNCPVVSLFHSPETGAIMQRLGILMKENQFGHSLYYSTGDSPAGQLLRITETIRLTFLLRSNDILFRNYTQPESGMTDNEPRLLSNKDFGGLSDGPATELPANWRTGDLGLVTIYVEETESGGARILENGVVTPADYSITYIVRETMWRCYLIDHSQPRHQGFALLDSASGEVVSAASNPPALKILPDGTEAVLLPAPSSFPPHQRPAARFSLHMKPKGSPQSTPITIRLQRGRRAGQHDDPGRCSRRDAADKLKSGDNAAGRFH